MERIQVDKSTHQYLKDEHGTTKSVLIPHSDYLSLMNAFAHIQRYSELRTDLKESVEELKRYRKGETELQTLDALLDELHD